MSQTGPFLVSVLCVEDEDDEVPVHSLPQLADAAVVVGVLCVMLSLIHI